MDGHGNVNMMNWRFLESSPTDLKAHLGLQLMSSTIDDKHLVHGDRGGFVRPHQQPQHNQNHHDYASLMAMSANGGLFHHHHHNHHLVGRIMESTGGMQYMRDPWINYNKERNLSLVSNDNHNHGNYGVFDESSAAHSLQMLLTSSVKNENEPSQPQLQESCEERDVDVGIVKKKRGAPKLQVEKSPKVKKAKRAPKDQKDESAISVPRIRAPKKSVVVVINGISIDISGFPIPVCTCTGYPQQCYKWGSGGWQSACCTTLLSIYPLPMNSKRRGARIAGRKMSVGAFKKVLEKLSSEGFNFSNPINLRNYWAKHGTNKFVTIR